MTEKAIIITNNKLAYDSFKEKETVVFVEGSLMDVLIVARDYIHKGHILLTHPLMGSIKPNETPFKSVAISEKCGNMVELDSLMYIEKSIETVIKMLKNKPLREWKESILEDFRVIDCDLIYNAFNN